MSRNRRKSGAAPRNFVAVISLGCPKNQVDTENLLGELLTRNVVLCPDPADASTIIVNTCGFIAPARAEGADVLAECLAYKRRGSCRTLAVAGCWVEREQDALKARYPEVDAWVGLLTPERIRALVDRLTTGARMQPCAERDVPLAEESGRVRLTPDHWAYLKIADGCDNRCAYCAIPEIRGCLRSKPHAAVVEEAKRLADEGVREVNLVAQDITAYGHDIDGRSHLAALLGDLARIDGVAWIRLLYAHPAHFEDDLIDLIADEPKICHYVDLPIQHVNDGILAAMGRKVTRARIERLVARLRERVPDIVLRTTVIAGFPGETDAEFDELLNFLQVARFERLGCFAYCSEPGTAAAALSGQLPEGERARRADEVMRLQQEIAFHAADCWIGREVPVIVDAPGEATGQFIGRTWGDAPDIDPVIYLTGDAAVGQITTARVTARRDYDLVGFV